MPSPFVIGRRTSFWLLALVLALLLSAASAPSPLYGVYQALWNFSPLTLTAIYASFALGGLGTLLTTGRLSDYLGRRPVLSIGLAVQAIAMLLFVFAGDVPWLFAARILSGAGIGIIEKFLQADYHILEASHRLFVRHDARVVTAHT